MRQRIFVTALTVLVAGLAVLAAGGRQAQKPVELPKPGVPEIMTIEGEFHPRGLQQRGLRHSRLPRGERVARRGVDAARDRHDDAPRKAELTRCSVRHCHSRHRTARRSRWPPMRNTCRSTSWPLQNRLKVQHDSIDYFPPTVNRGGPHRLLLRSRDTHESLRSGRAQSAGGLGRPHLLQDSWRDQIRPALLERAAQGKSRAGAVSNPDRRGGEAPHEELSGHPRAGSGSVQEEVERSAIACEQDRDLVGPGRECNLNRAGR